MIGVARGIEPTGVCVVRVQHPDHGPLIRLLFKGDIREVSGEWERSFGDVDDAVTAIRGFIESCLAGRDPRDLP